MSALIGFMVAERSPIPSEPPKADWDGEIHPTREQADTECAQANRSGGESDDQPDDPWRVVAVVEVGALDEAEKRGAVKALRMAAGAEMALNGPTLALERALRLADQIESGEVTP